VCPAAGAAAAAAGPALWDPGESTRLGYSEAGYDPAFMLPFCVHVRGLCFSSHVTCLEMCAKPCPDRVEVGSVHRAQAGGARWRVSGCCVATAGSAGCRWPPGRCASCTLLGMRQALRTGAASCHQLARCGLLALALRALAAADAALRALAYEAAALAAAALASEDCRCPPPRRCLPGLRSSAQL